jgi:hypothetical protein
MIDIKSLNFPALSIGISIPVIMCIILQLNNILGKINPIFNVILNLETFVTIY